MSPGCDDGAFVIGDAKDARRVTVLGTRGPRSRGCLRIPGSMMLRDCNYRNLSSITWLFSY